MKDIMLADTPVEQRAQILRDSCDQIVERSYTRKFDQEEINERRADLANVAIQKADLEQSLAEIRADYKGKIKPLEERIVKLRDELKAGGDCMKLVSVLKNFTANAKTEIQKQRDPSGSMAEVYRSQVESNLPKSFTINIAIFKGTAKTPIEVEFDHYLSNGDVLLQLVSPGANELAEDYRDKCIDEVLDGIRAIAPDIAILEI